MEFHGLEDEDELTWNEFGAVVSFSGEGALIGVPSDEWSESGRAYLFD